MIGNSLMEMTCLKFFKTMDRIRQLKWFDEVLKDANKDYKNYHILKTANDDYQREGLFMLIEESQGTKK